MVLKPFTIVKGVRNNLFIQLGPCLHKLLQISICKLVLSFKKFFKWSLFGPSSFLTVA
ncbi:hypothetical protein Hanom_Chr14g01260771 [Helianthus anomalus]